MKKHLLKTMLTALILLVGGVNVAWSITVTETYDFGGFITANGVPAMTLGTDVVATQSGTSEFTGGDLYLLQNPTSNGQTLNLNGRFAIDYGASAGQKIRFMWRSSGNAYQHGLAGQWNNGGNANTACHLSVLNLKAGDKITLTWAVQSGKDAQPYLCATGAVTDMNADAYLASGTEYTIAKDGNLDLYFKNNNFAVSKIVVVTEKSSETMGAPAIKVTGVSGVNRIVTITPGEGDAGSEATATYYTLDGSDPTDEKGVLYSEPITISSTTTVKAVSYLNDAMGTVQTLDVEAGTALSLNVPVCAISDIVEGVGKTYTVNSDNTNILLSPSASYSYVFTPADGSDAENGTGATITITKLGTLVVTASAEGYTSSETTVVNDTEYEVGASLSLKDPDVLAENDASWTYNAAGTRFANWYGYNNVSKANYPYWTPASEGKGTIGDFTFVPGDNLLMRTIGFIHNSGDKNLSLTELDDNTTVKFIVSTYLENPINVFVDAVEGTATYTLGAGSSGYAVEGVQLYKKVTPAPVITVAAPTFSPGNGEYTEAQTVTLNCETEGATIYYTTDGDDPTTESTPYTESITVSETMTIKAIAVLNGVESKVAEATYTIIPPVTTVDLAITKLNPTTSPYDLSSGKSNPLHLIVNNNGDAPTNDFIVKYYKNDDVEPFRTVDWKNPEENLSPIAAGRGQLLDIKLEEYIKTPGEYTLRAELVSDNDISPDDNVFDSSVTIYMLGDANVNGEVTTSDAVATVSYILKLLVPDKVQKLSADVEKSNTITVSDAVGIVNIAMSVEPEAEARGEEPAVNYLTMENKEIGLVNSTGFSAFQMDVTLSDGTMLGGARQTERTAGMLLKTNKIGSNTWRIVALSLDGSAISGSEGSLLSLDIVGQGSVSVSNVEFADRAARAYKLDFESPTGINSLYNNKVEDEVYSVSGARSNSVKKGVNVVRQADGKVRKVLVK